MDEIHMPDFYRDNLEKAKRMLQDVQFRIGETEQAQLRATTEAERYSCAAALAQLRQQAAELSAQIDSATANLHNLGAADIPQHQQQ